VLSGHGRYDYSAIVHRPDYCWPGGRRLAVYVALNLEQYAFGEGMREEIAPAGPAGEPDVMNYSWLDYGNRVGAWRLHELFGELALPCTLLVNSELYDHCPELAEAFSAAGHEIAAHGRTNSERQGGLTETAEAALIETVTSTIAQHAGRRPSGWLGPWISESLHTPDLLQEAGYEYVLDWCCDDQPVWFTTRRGRLLAIPYPQEINDSNTVIGRRVNPWDFTTMIIDQFDEMKRQSHRQPLVMGIALHAHCAGQPFRLPHFRRALEHICAQRDEIWLTTAVAIARHVSAPAVDERSVADED
jgi:allantoinase